jgi:hypothetical protein
MISIPKKREIADWRFGLLSSKQGRVGAPAKSVSLLRFPFLQSAVSLLSFDLIYHGSRIRETMPGLAGV